MNVKRFVGKNSREAMAQVRGAFGDQAVVLANRPIPGGVEILAMAGDVPPATSKAAAAPVAPMSTLSFQEFVRERQRQDAQAAEAEAAPAATTTTSRRQAPVEPGRFAAEELRAQDDESALPAPTPPSPYPGAARAFSAVAQAIPGEELLAEMKSMRGMIASQLANLTWFDSVRRDPAQTQLLRLMIGNGFSPKLARHLVHRVPADRNEAQASQWLMDMLAHNLQCAEGDGLPEGGVFALVGPTGVGKTTTTAKLAARFAMKHGPASVGLITVDTYRMAASDQLRAFGKLLNIPVHTARDNASLIDLLDLFGGKKLVLIDTVGVGQRDRRLGELFAALPTSRVERLLVLNAGAQAETLEEVVSAYGAQPGSRCVLTKLDEAAKCGGVIDVAIRHRLRVEGFANGQRVPEDWHAARAPLLVQKALMKPALSAFMPDDDELGLMLTAPETAARSVRPMEAQRV